MLSTVTLFTVLATGLAATVDIAWQASMVQTATAQRGDTLSFTWGGLKPVTQVVTKTEFDNCETSYTYNKTGLRSPSEVVVPTDTPDGTVLYFIDSYSDHCTAKGIKVAVTVTGGEGGTSGQCVAIACRVTTPQSEGVPLLDYSCCSVGE